MFKSKYTKSIYDLRSFEDFAISSIKQTSFLKKPNYIFSLQTNERKESLLSKLSNLDKLNKFYRVVYGIKTGNNKRFVSKEKLGNLNWKKCASSARNIQKYKMQWQGDFLNVSKELAGLSNLNYEQPKILIQYIRKISMPTRLVCALDEIGEYYPLNNFSFIISTKQYSLKSLLGILNSSLMNWYFKNCFVDYNIKPKYIERLPLPESFDSVSLERKVEQVILAKSKGKDTTELEAKIDQMVYQLYGLSEEEIAIVESES